MVKIRPFRGYRYNKEKVDIGKAIFPPYELTSKQFRDIFLKISDYNIIRVILGNENLPGHERYRYSASLLDSWISKGYLKKDGRPCIYVYSQEFEINGKKKDRTGFISLVRLEKLGKSIMPHEFTFHDEVVDMGALLENTRANLGPIFSVYSDRRKGIESVLEKIKRETSPEMEVLTDHEGVRHRLWKVEDKKTIDLIAEKMECKRLLIADGHHRYNICFEYSRAHPHDEKAKYISMMMVRMENEGLVILPTHRLVKGIKNFDREKLIRSLGKDFRMETIGFGSANENEKLEEMLKRINGRDWRCFGMYTGGKKFYILGLKDARAVDAIKNHSMAWRRLGVNVLHTLVIKGVLDASAPIDERRNVEYVKDIRGKAMECVRRVRDGECQIAFFMRPVKIGEVEEISGSGEMMPQKSTCFYPKVYSGLVIYKFENGGKNF